MQIPDSLTLLTAMLDYVAQNRHAFHTPGHKGGKGLASSLLDQSLGALDLTEIPGLDDLHQPTGIIAEAQLNCASWCGAKASFFLVNGASVGIQAAFLACLGPGDTVMIPRNAHKSVTAGLILSGARPIYYMPVIHPDFNLPLGINSLQVADKIVKTPGLKALVALYPTYYGTTWCLQEVREVWHGLLIADEAHGAHFPFSDSMPISALKLGADIVVHSTHKTLGSLTQGAMLHLGDAAFCYHVRVKQALDLLQTTSPSYLIMASLEGATYDGYRTGQKHWTGLAARADLLKKKMLARGVRVLNSNDIDTYGIADVDSTKILVSTPSSRTILAALIDNYGIQPELWDENNILFLLGVGDTEESIAYLENALLNTVTSEHVTLTCQTLPELPRQCLTPREAYFTEKVAVRLKESVGRVCAETLAPYPPGIPLIVPGEIINAEIVDYITAAKQADVHWQGNSDPTLQQVMVLKETR